MALMIKFKETLTQLIRDRGFSGNTKKLADQVGVTPSALSQYAHGHAQPTVKRLVEIANVLGVSLDYLVYGDAENQASAVDFGPAMRYVDQRLLHQQEKTDAQTRIVGRLADALAWQLKTAAANLAARGSWQGGIITDDELLTIEAYSKESRLILMAFDYDVAANDDEPAAGPFLPVVAGNLARGYKYKILLPAHARDWRPEVSRYRTLLRTLCKSDSVMKGLSFRRADAPIISGCGIYTLDTERLEKEQQIKYIRFENWINHNRLGYIIAASRSLQADSLMDLAHLGHATRLFDALWNKGKEL